MKALSSRNLIVLSAGLLLISGCSKTRDSAPETRVFGDPPVIASATADPNPMAAATCDYTNAFLANFAGGPPNKGFCDERPILNGPLMVTSTYTAVTLEAIVTDPNDPAPPATGTDVLLVTASYVTDSGGTPQENSIVMFDDGSQIVFPFGQKHNIGLTDCTAPINDNCTCTQAVYDVTSNDPTPGDKTFTRVFAFAPGGSGIPNGMDGLFLDCIADANGQASQIAGDLAEAQIEFRIEAVDKNGNLTEAGNRPTATVGTGGLTCTGDPCACCILINNVNPEEPVANGGCFGLDGLRFDDRKICQSAPSGTPPNLGAFCTTDADCGGFLASCRTTTYGGICPNGLCTSTTCLSAS